MGDLAWTRHNYWTYPLKALRYHTVLLGASGSGKTETIQRIAYGAQKTHQMQIIYLDAKGETKRDEEEGEDNAARFVATMHAAGAHTIAVFPSTYYNGWQGSPLELKNRLLSVVDYSESAYYGDVAANVLDLALTTPPTPRSSSHFLANLRLDRLKEIYKHTPDHYQRVLHLDKDLLAQVEMRYQGFFRAMDGMLDGTLDYASADAVYLRVRGFTLRNEAPRLGRFLIADFMHYVAERRRAGLLTMLIIDEFNALRMREETSILFEQARSFGACLVISAQGYRGLGPNEYADRILDACSTYIVHACSDPFQIVKRAGKRFRFDSSWSETEGDEQSMPRKTIRPVWDWRIREDDVIQQETGQAYWIYRGHAQQVQTAQIPVRSDGIRTAWIEIRRQEEVQSALVTAEKQRQQEQRAQKHEGVPPTSSSNNRTPKQKAPPARRSTSSTQSNAPANKTSLKASKSSISLEQALPLPPAQGTTIVLPQRVPEDDEPDRFELL